MLLRQPTTIAVRWMSMLTTLLAFSLISPSVSSGCTTVVVSGSATVDGRPLLWKNRDFWQRQNEILRDDTGELAFVGVANAEAVERIRMGVNTAGFCIENSVSRDLNSNLGPGPNNGELIRVALQTCRTVGDFQSFLDRTNADGRRSYGNFGVIDADGGAVMFEVAPRTYRVYDANDPVAAPHGFVVRANFSELAQERNESNTSTESLYSIERYSRAYDLCLAGVESDQLDLRYLLQNVSRDVEGCSVCGPDNATTSPISEAVTPSTTITTSKTLNRNNTVSATVFHGVRNGESPDLTTMWTLLGEPLFTVAVPTWAKQQQVSSLVNGAGAAPICRISERLASTSYDERHRNLKVSVVKDIAPPLVKVEDQILKTVESQREQWLRNSPTADDLFAAHHSAAQIALNSLTKQPLLAMLAAAEESPADVTASGIDFMFNDANDTRLASTKNSASAENWDGGFTDSTVQDGSYRIRRNYSKTATRYIDLSPDVRVKAASSGSSYTRRGWLVVNVAGWNLRGKTPNEYVRFGFTSQSDKALHTAAMVLERTNDDEVTLSGIGFGDGSSEITSTKTWPLKQTQPVTFVLELDKADGNPDEGDTGGVYRIFYRQEGDKAFTQLGTGGTVRRLRNGNYVHFRMAGFFAATDEYFDIDRIYFTKTDPVGASANRVHPTAE